MKKLAFLPFIGIIFLTISCSSLIRNKLTKKNFKEIETISHNTFEEFYWANDTILGTYMQKTALYIPIKLENLNEKVLFQLDLGSSSSEMYAKSLHFLNLNKTDSLGYLWNVKFTTNNSISKINKIFVHKNLGTQERLNGKIKIGNLGHDYFLNKILVLDYKNNRFIVTDSLAKTFYIGFEEIKNVSINKFPILIESILNGNRTKTMFDTGSSIIDYMTYPEKFRKLTQNTTVTEKCCVKAFGKDYTLSEAKTTNTLEIFNTKILNLKVSTTSKFLEDKQAIFGMKLLGIDGITGNKFLLDKIIIMNFIENKFWIK